MVSALQPSYASLWSLRRAGSVGYPPRQRISSVGRYRGQPWDLNVDWSKPIKLIPFPLAMCSFPQPPLRSRCPCDSVLDKGLQRRNMGGCFWGIFFSHRKRTLQRSNPFSSCLFSCCHVRIFFLCQCSHVSMRRKVRELPASHSGIL